ncbi:Uncharacterized protein dnm_056280 [Desulfonema magnum]|uniref:Uncharacterized protein n=1 Tax=Desulfonema magnum TaxID=45655 RepID=A0A975BQ00_9BACT|nr:Uncharacterized protein dnm_056280 [Desulfonema magnum]
MSEVRPTLSEPEKSYIKNYHITPWKSRKKRNSADTKYLAIYFLVFDCIIENSGKLLAGYLGTGQ